MNNVGLLGKFISLILIIAVISCGSEKNVQVAVVNSLDVVRSNETVKLSKSDLGIAIEEDLSSYGIAGENGDLQVIQLIDEDSDGKNDHLLFQPTVAPKSTSTYTIKKLANDAESSDAAMTCFSRFVPERTDDYAWENDMVAFRTFGPVAQKMVEDGVKGGTLTSGIDCWLKKVNYPIIDKWYDKETNKKGSYHEDTGEGLDNFHVGKSRGCGGIAVKVGDSIYTSKNFTTHKNLANGAIRTAFTLGYEDWDAGDKKITETKNIYLDKGTNLTAYNLDITGTDHIWVGLTLHEKDGKVSFNSAEGWFSYWEPHGDSELGMGILVDPGIILGHEKVETDVKDMSHLFVKLKVSDNKVSYKAGFGWKESGDFEDQKSWEEYLSLQSKFGMNPLTVNIISNK